jgi:hypothetical protein
MSEDLRTALTVIRSVAPSSQVIDAVQASPPLSNINDRALIV